MPLQLRAARLELERRQRFSWQPREYQKPLWDYLHNGGKRAAAVWHRRAGKDDVCLHWTKEAALKRVGTYWHMLPQASQARKAIWTAVNPHTGLNRVTEVFTPDIVKTKRDNEMFIEFNNGSTWQVVGSDNYNSLVGAPPVGIVFSEWSLADPQAYDFLRPILRENGGWALFIYTPRGPNHGHSMYEMAKDNEGWFAELLTVEDTGVISQEAIQADRDEGMAEEMVQQEYYCSFDAPLVGSYFGKQMKLADDEDRITEVPLYPDLPVHTAWDIGIRDATVIWFYQKVGGAVHLVDYHEETDQPTPYFAKLLQDKGYVYGSHYVPHDAKERSKTTGKSIRDTLKDLGVRTEMAPNLRVQDGIDASRALLGRCSFDKVKCERGVKCLKGYRKKWNDEMKVFSDTPVHDWASHAADAFRYLAVSLKRPVKGKDIKPDMRWVV